MKRLSFALLFLCAAVGLGAEARAVVVVARAGAEVSSCATGGDGSVERPFVGWDTACRWTGSTWTAGAGHYAAAAAPAAWASDGFALVGAGPFSTIFDLPLGLSVEAPTYMSYIRVRFEGFAVNAGPGAVNVFRFRNLHRSYFRLLKATGHASGAAFLFEGEVGGQADSLSAESFKDLEELDADCGVRLSASGPGQPVTAMHFTNLQVRRVHGYGVDLAGATFCTFRGYSERSFWNWHIAAIVSWGNVFDGCDSELGTAGGFLIEGYGNTITGGLSSDLIRLTVGSFSNVIAGGVHDAVTVEPGALQNALRDFSFNLTGGAILDQGTSTRISNLRNQTTGDPLN